MKRNIQVFLGAAFGLLAAVPTWTAEDEAAGVLQTMEHKVPRFQVIDFRPQAGEVRLSAKQSLTVEDLRGVELDDEPPVIRTPATSYPSEQTDGLPPGEGPYVARDIKPFRLREFTAEFNYGGWHNFNLIDYAATHGFRVIYPYVMADRSHFPQGTPLLRWGSFVDWPKFFAQHGIPWGRFDRLAELDVVKELLDAGEVWEYAPDGVAMLDLEHSGPLSPEDLRKQEWFPQTATDDEKVAFERKYYTGYLRTYTALVEALHQKGWTSVGVYPQPYGSGWYALLGLAEKGLPGIPDPATHWPWVKYGRAMVEAQDVLYPDLYVYYWSPQNVAYTLARIDFDRRLINSMTVRKPYRPYYWPLLHGGDADYHWWSQQPLPNEDLRALFALSFFAGCDGVVLWNWSEFDNHHLPPPLWRKGQTTLGGEKPIEGGVGADVMLQSGFDLKPEGAGEADPPTRFQRYDVLAVTDVDETAGTVRFQHLATGKQRWGPRLDEKKPTYVMKQADLIPHLRPLSEPVAGAIEGLALVKPFERFLRRAEVQVDVPALDQFVQTLPIVRRMKWGRTHLLATYDPLCVQGGPPREIVLKDFDGHPGLALTLPADAQTRLFALREVPE
jgi:hypothetical protein